MVKKLILGFLLTALISNSFAGYSSGGGRSGFSGGSRGVSVSRSYSSPARSGYSRSINTSRTYVAPRSYSGSRSSTIIHNNHYSHGGYGFGGNGFFHGLLGGYIGGSLANNNHTTVVAGGSQVIPQGQGMLVEQAYVQPHYGLMSVLFGLMVFFLISMLIVWLAVKLFRFICYDNNYPRNRW